ncbi:unnamed protein product [Microthlaspi erraticum]|uniref:Uncharacterized protein n=1 Tax=Microthlaspi erraticum TaxID=1685480 RepID=A0A6D2HZ35_9BRAS|nr:unnamed protein product [Microthlaspi erraticum]
MDFIKTSSLRALIELTFQRNWNGLIWMSRKGVITKRVKTVQTALSRISAQPRSPAGRGTNVPRSAKSRRPSEVSAKVQNRSADHAITTRETLPAVGQATPRPAHDQTAEPGERLAAAQLSAYHGRCRPSRETTSRVRPRFHRPNLHRPTTAADHASGPDRSDSATTRLSGRSSRPTVPTPRQSLCSIPILPRSVHLQRSRSLVKPDSASKPAVGHATTGHATTAHDQSARAGSNASRPRNSPHVPRTNASSDPGNYASRPAEDFHRPIPIRPTTPADRHNIGPTVPTRPKTRLSGRSSRTTVRMPRSTRSRF